MQQWVAGGHPEQDAALCRAVGVAARAIKPLLVGGIVAPIGPTPGREAVFLALLTMEGNVEKLELFPEDGVGMVNRVDVSLGVDALELVLSHCTGVGPGGARSALRGGR